MKMSYDEVQEKYYFNNEGFKEALFKEYEVEDNPKREKCFYFAWVYGHANGLYDVYSCFEDLVELIK